LDGIEPWALNASPLSVVLNGRHYSAAFAGSPNLTASNGSV
jgi:hypothetical protein